MILPVTAYTVCNEHKRRSKWNGVDRVPRARHLKCGYPHLENSTIFQTFSDAVRHYTTFLSHINTRNMFYTIFSIVRYRKRKLSFRAEKLGITHQMQN